MLTALFVYGTLLDPLVRRLVTGSGDARPPVKAWLAHWYRGGIAGRSYPIIVRRPRARVRGLLLRGLTPLALARLDAYETDEYQRISGRVRTARGWRRCELYACATIPVFAQRRWHFADWSMRHRRGFITSLKTRKNLVSQL